MGWHSTETEREVRNLIANTPLSVDFLRYYLICQALESLVCAEFTVHQKQRKQTKSLVSICRGYFS